MGMLVVDTADGTAVYDAEFEAIMANIDVVITKGDDFWFQKKSKALELAIHQD